MHETSDSPAATPSPSTSTDEGRAVRPSAVPPRAVNDDELAAIYIDVWKFAARDAMDDSVQSLSVGGARRRVNEVVGAIHDGDGKFVPAKKVDFLVWVYIAAYADTRCQTLR